MIQSETRTIIRSSWESLKIHTNARIAIGRCGNSIPTKEFLSFKLAHAKAIDAVHTQFEKNKIIYELEEISGNEVLSLKSNAKNRAEYLQRPDFGRSLSEGSIQLIKNTKKVASYDISIIVADGLSTMAIEKNISALLTLLLPELRSRDYSLAPICVIEQSRVAIADPVAELFNARMSIILIGERPGLMSPDSLGIYLTYLPRIGTTDERRNCISNVRQEGLSYSAATDKLLYLVDKAFKLQISGVNLKDEQNLQLPINTTQISLS